jgi:hypothetical protein
MSTGVIDPTRSSEVSGYDNEIVKDVEKGHELSRHLTNNALSSFSWSDVGVTVEDRKTKKPIQILSSSYGSVQAGSVVALMGMYSFPCKRLFSLRSYLFLFGQQQYTLTEAGRSKWKRKDYTAECSCSSYIHHEGQSPTNDHDE